MDPHPNQTDTRNQLNPRGSSAAAAAAANPTNRTSDMSGNDQTHDNPNRMAPDSGTDPQRTDPQRTDRQPCYSTGFTMIPPNEARRSQMTKMAQKEEEELQRWRESNRVQAVHLNPERVGGGNVTLVEARERQFTEMRCAKLQKKLKQEELDKRRRREEEEKLQKMKAEQRQKTERLEERKRREEQRRREQFQQDQLRTTDNFLQRFERRAPGPLASSSATHTSSGSEAMESEHTAKPKKSDREVEEDHRRVNSDFLDRLEGRSRASETESFGLSSEELGGQQPSTPGQHLPPRVQPRPDLDQDRSGWAEEADPDPDYEWALMKLMSNFPDCSRVFLEDILDQCNSDYQQAFSLLNCTLT